MYPTYKHVLKKPDKGENSKQCVLLTRETRVPNLFKPF